MMRSLVLVFILHPSCCLAAETCEADGSGSGACSGVVKGEEVGTEKSQKDFYDSWTKVYDLVWAGRMRPGYYPHLAKPNAIRLNTSQAGDMMTTRMIDLANINHTSVVLDLGCGQGQACQFIAKATGASCTGVDLASSNIEIAKRVASELPHLDLSYVEGSFTDFPSEVASKRYTHIFSQVAFVHVQKLLPQILAQAKAVLMPGGTMVLNEYLGSDQEISAATREHVYKRLHFEDIYGHKTWRRTVEENGYSIMHYENLDAHMKYGYLEAAEKADSLGSVGIKSADGALLSDNYRGTAAAIAAKEIGMNLVLLVPE